MIYEYQTLYASHGVNKSGELETLLRTEAGVGRPLSDYGAEGWELVTFDTMSIEFNAGEVETYKVAVLRRPRARKGV